MVRKVGSEVALLHRYQIGKFKLPFDVPFGHYKRLSKPEIQALCAGTIDVAPEHLARSSPDESEEWRAGVYKRTKMRKNPQYSRRLKAYGWGPGKYSYEARGAAGCEE